MAAGVTAWDVLPIALLAPVLVFVALSDLRRMRIPNAASLLMLGLFVLCVPFVGTGESLLRAAAGAVVFTAFFALFAANLVGGGDAKVLPALVLFVPSPLWVIYANLLALSLLVGIAAVLAVQAIPNGGASAWAVRRNRGAFPMGLSIALSGLLLPPVALLL